MPAPIPLTVASGFAVSSAFFLPRAGTWAVQVPSMTGCAVRIEFATASGGSGDFGAVFTTPTADAVVASSAVRPAWGTFVAVTPFGRIATSAAVADTASLMLHPVNG